MEACNVSLLKEICVDEDEFRLSSDDQAVCVAFRDCKVTRREEETSVHVQSVKSTSLKTKNISKVHKNSFVQNRREINAISQVLAYDYTLSMS